MDASFRGRFESKSDPKGRLSLPASLRQSLSSKEQKLVVTNSQFKGQRSLDVYSWSAWERLEKRIAKLSPLKTEVQEFRRFYMAGGQVVEMDSQGRILIPQTLRRYAGLELDVVLVGLGEKFEIWSANTWNLLYEGLAQNFEANLAAVAAIEEHGDE